MRPHLTDGAGPGKQVVKALLRATSDGADDDDDNKLVATHELFGLMVPACLRRLWTRVKSWILELQELHQYCIAALRDNVYMCYFRYRRETSAQRMEQNASHVS